MALLDEDLISEEKHVLDISFVDLCRMVLLKPYRAFQYILGTRRLNYFLWIVTLHALVSGFAEHNFLTYSLDVTSFFIKFIAGILITVVYLIADVILFWIVGIALNGSDRILPYAEITIWSYLPSIIFTTLYYVMYFVTYQISNDTISDHTRYILLDVITGMQSIILLLWYLYIKYQGTKRFQQFGTLKTILHIALPLLPFLLYGILTEL